VTQLLDDVLWDRDAGVVPLELKVVSKVTPSCCSGVIALPSLSDPFEASPWPSCSPRRVHRLTYRPDPTGRLIVAERGSNYLQQAARSYGPEPGLAWHGPGTGR
jgi:hypothetical protein